MRVHSQCFGRFTISTDKRGKLAEFDNLITNAGLNYMASAENWLLWCQVGSGSTVPTVADTALANRIAGTSTVQANVEGVQASAPYYVWRRITKRFAAGEAAGNLSEVSMGWAPTGGLFSRALILDSEGEPTTITVQADETLDVTYEFRFYPKVVDDVGEFAVTGNRGDTYDFIARACNVTLLDSTSGWSTDSGGRSMAVNTSSAMAQLFTGEIGLITGSPSGTGQANGSRLSNVAYVNDSFTRVFRLTLGLSNGNIGGIRSARIRMGIGNFQFQFDPAIPKLSDAELILDFSHSWGRVV